MKFTLEVGNNERSKLDVSRNWFTGAMHVLVNGDEVAQRRWLAPSTHFSFARKRRYEFAIGKIEKHEVAIEQERPLIMAGFRPQTYRVYVDGELVHEESGY